MHAELVKAVSCNERNHCVMCRTSERARQQWLDQGWVTQRDFACPFGVTSETAEAIQTEALKKLGAQVAVKGKPCGTPCGAKAAHKENLSLIHPDFIKMGLP